jgi:hypothetical protein
MVKTVKEVGTGRCRETFGRYFENCDMLIPRRERSVEDRLETY